jgi:hypothetical protein
VNWSGSGLCFNGGRLLAATMLIFSGWLKSQSNIDFRTAISLLSLVYLLGAMLVILLPETRDKPLEE